MPFEKEKVVQVYFAETERKQPSFYTVSVIFLKATWLIKYEDGTKRNMVFRVHPQIFSGISNFHFEHVFVYKGQKKLFSDVVKHIIEKYPYLLNSIFVVFDIETAPPELKNVFALNDGGGPIFHRKLYGVLQKPEYHL